MSIKGTTFYKNSTLQLHTPKISVIQALETEITANKQSLEAGKYTRIIKEILATVVKEPADEELLRQALQNFKENNYGKKDLPAFDAMINAIILIAIKLHKGTDVTQRELLVAPVFTLLVLQVATTLLKERQAIAITTQLPRPSAPPAPPIESAAHSLPKPSALLATVKPQLPSLKRPSAPKPPVPEKIVWQKVTLASVASNWFFKIAPLTLTFKNSQDAEKFIDSTLYVGGSSIREGNTLKFTSLNKDLINLLHERVKIFVPAHTSAIVAPLFEYCKNRIERGRGSFGNCSKNDKISVALKAIGNIINHGIHNRDHGLSNAEKAVLYEKNSKLAEAVFNCHNIAEKPVNEVSRHIVYN